MSMNAASPNTPKSSKVNYSGPFSAEETNSSNGTLQVPSSDFQTAAPAALGVDLGSAGFNGGALNYKCMGAIVVRASLNLLGTSMIS